MIYLINKELYDELLKKRGIKTDKAEVTEKDYEITEYDLSYGQKGMWFLQQMEPDNPVYNNPYEVAAAIEPVWKSRY